MHFQEIRRAAAQGTISLPPPMDSEGLEDLAVLKSCLKVMPCSLIPTPPDDEQSPGIFHLQEDFE